MWSCRHIDSMILTLQLVVNKTPFDQVPLKLALVEVVGGADCVHIKCTTNLKVIHVHHPPPSPVLVLHANTC